MKFGLFYLPTTVPGGVDFTAHFDQIVEQVVFAEKIGIDYAWFAEHHFVTHGGICASNYTLMAYLAAKTTRMRFGAGATVLPINDPIRVAESAATLDRLSHGRFDLGIGRGFLRREFDTFGIDMKESRERVEEGIEIVKKAWTGTLTANPKFGRATSHLPILPTPQQKPHPPIWVACFLTRESFEWTAAQGYNLLYVAYHVDPPVAKERIDWYLAPLRASGKKGEVCVCYHAFFQETDDVAALRRKVEGPMLAYSAAGAEAARLPVDPVAYKGYAAREDYHKQASFDVFFPNRVLMGGPERVLERLKWMKDAGITQVTMIVDFGGIAHGEIMRSLDVFARDVLPKARQL